MWALGNMWTSKPIMKGDMESTVDSQSIQKIFWTSTIKIMCRENLTLLRKFVFTSFLQYQPRRQRIKEASLLKAYTQSQKLEIRQTRTCNFPGFCRTNALLTQKVGILFPRLFLFNCWCVMLCPRGWICCLCKSSLKVPSSHPSCPKRKHCACRTKANAALGAVPLPLIRLLAFSVYQSSLILTVSLYSPWWCFNHMT